MLEAPHPDLALPAGIMPALAERDLGLCPASDFVIPGAASGTPDAVRWYFEDEVVAVPKPGMATADFSRGRGADEDVRTWFAAADEAALMARPQLLWLAGTLIARDVSIDATGQGMTAASGVQTAFRVTDRIASNRSYYDPSSAHFFSRRKLHMRGGLATRSDGAPVFVARTIWPQDYVLDASAPFTPLGPAETLRTMVEQCLPGASAHYGIRVLWERQPGGARSWAGRPALGIVLNGAQSDDDEALGGHFALATGHVGPHGEWAHWITNNFYSLEWFSEKGIIASMLPMDNYLMDLNAGQSYYRPSYMLVALLNRDRAALAYQAGVSRVFHHFYRQDLPYSHSQANCAGISLDTLRALGWNIPRQGPTSYITALAAFAFMGLKERSLAVGKSAFHYFTAERTRLLPAVAFYAAGTDLLQLVGALAGPRRAPSRYEDWLRQDVEAIAFVQIPQIPSSRAFGSYPVASLEEYRARTPRDRSQWKIIPLERRPFPSDLATQRPHP